MGDRSGQRERGEDTVLDGRLVLPEDFEFPGAEVQEASKVAETFSSQELQRLLPKEIDSALQSYRQDEDLKMSQQ